jgi:Ca-activated chloride channel homolog
MKALSRAPLARRLPLLIFVLAFLFSPSVNSQTNQDEDDVVRVNTDLVVLNLTVTDRNGQYVSGLDRSAFRVFEDGREQTITTFSLEETPFAAVLLLDTSGSMESRMSLARSAAIRFLDGLRADDVAAVYSFDVRVQPIQEFSASRDLSPLVFDVRARGYTSLYDAIVRAARDLSARAERRRAIVVLSDGADNRSSANFDRALNAALAANATIYTVDLSDPTNTQRHSAVSQLRAFATRSGGRFVSTPGGRSLREAFTAIVEELGRQYTIGYQPMNAERNGRWREIEVRTARPELQVRTRTGYRASRR